MIILLSTFKPPIVPGSNSFENFFILYIVDNLSVDKFDVSFEIYWDSLNHLNVTEIQAGALQGTP